MLILTRYKGEVITIGDDIRIAVVDIRSDSGGTKIRIGIDAPKDVKVHRLEVYNAIKREEEKTDE